MAAVQTAMVGRMPFTMSPIAVCDRPCDAEALDASEPIGYRLPGERATAGPASFVGIRKATRRPRSSV